MTAENFANKAAFVTGAASGIGLATAQAFAAAGAAAALVDLHEEAAENAAASIRSKGVKQSLSNVTSPISRQLR